MKRPHMARLAVLVAVTAAILLFFLFDLDRHLTLEALQQSREAILAQREAHPFAVSALFFAAYLLIAVLALPAAALMTLAGGAIFGLWWGTLLVSFASTLGATLAFLLARFLLRDFVQARYGRRLDKVNEGLRREGWAYLFSIRLIPLFPFAAVNFSAGLTSLRTWTFYWVSQVSMLPATIVVVNAGTQLARLDSMDDLLSPQIIGALVLLALLPFFSRGLVRGLRRRRLYRAYPRPRNYDANVLVIGGGSAGLVTAYIANALRAKVTLVEQDRMGGDCLHTGCVPSKTLLASGKLAARMRHAARYGLRPVSVEADFGAVMGRVRAAIAHIEPHDSVERYRQLGVDCIPGRARIIDPWTVEVEGRRISARSLVIATGAEPAVPPLPGLEQTGYRTSETIWELDALPRRLLVLGGGPIGCELGQAFARLGSEVTLIEMGSRLLPHEDPEFGSWLRERLEGEGLQVRTETEAVRVEAGPEGRHLVCKRAGREQSLPFDELLIATGRRPRLAGFGLEELGLLRDGRLTVNRYLQTRMPNIYACGDVVAQHQFTHNAAHMAWTCAVNACFGRFYRLRHRPEPMPWATFTDPEVARVGLNEQEARTQGIAYEVTVVSMAELDRAITDGETEGWIKVLTAPRSDRILGVTIAGSLAGEVIAEFVLAMRHRLGLGKILGTVHIYPTFSELNRTAAGRWRQAHTYPRALQWLARFQDWSRH